MQKVRLVCLDSDKPKVVSALHSVGLLDLRKSRLDLADDMPASNFTALSDAEIRLAGALALLRKPKSRGAPKGHEPKSHLGPQELVSAVSSLKSIDRIYELAENKKKAMQSIRQLELAEQTVRQISGIDIDIDSLRSDALSFKAFSAKSPKDIAGLKHDISKRKVQAEAVVSGTKGQFSLILAYAKGLDVEQLARKHSLKEIDLTSPYLKGTPRGTLKAILLMKAEDRNRMKTCEAEIEKAGASEYAGLSSLMEMVKIELLKAGASGIFKRTDHAVIIEGWVPKKNLSALEGRLSKASEGRYYMEHLKADELAPTLMNRPKILQPFDFMINFLSVPRSDELDPAIPFMISFPIFYGLMVTDVGYGLLSLLFSTYITKITDPEGLVCNTAKIWQLCAVSAIVFGVLSNQYFGLALNQYFIPGFTGFDWFSSVTSIIVIAIAFGLVQVTMGLAFGVVNAFEHDHRKLAYGRVCAIVLMVTGTVAIAGGLFSVFPATVTEAAAAVAILMLVLTIVLSGEEGAEVTNLISHPLSYIRLMGFGLASVVLAFLIDKGFTPSLSSGPVLFVVYLIIFLVLHFLNMIVSMFEGAVQGARLNFIEFFTKFYKGGGVPYKPFSSKRVYTKETV